MCFYNFATYISVIIIAQKMLNQNVKTSDKIISLSKDLLILFRISGIVYIYVHKIQFSLVKRYTKEVFLKFYHALCNFDLY